MWPRTVIIEYAREFGIKPLSRREARRPPPNGQRRYGFFATELGGPVDWRVSEATPCEPGFGNGSSGTVGVLTPEGVSAMSRWSQTTGIEGNGIRPWRGRRGLDLWAATPPGSENRRMSRWSATTGSWLCPLQATPLRIFCL